MPHTTDRVERITANPARTRADLTALLGDLVAPLVDAQSPGCSRVRLGPAVVGYDDAAAELEGFSRALWGIAPLFAGGAAGAGGADGAWNDVQRRWLDGMKHGTDPEHGEWWGDCTDFDQRLVEQAGIVRANSILVAPDAFWHPLEDETKARLGDWLLQGNNLEHPSTNWRFFRVLVNVALKHVGAEYSQAEIDEQLETTEAFIGPDCLPSDGPHGVSPSYDYYATSFAIPFYGVILSKHYPSHSCAQLWRERAAVLAPRVVHLFAPDGAAIPFGRSMTYRFACAAFWAAVAYAEIELPEPFTLGVIKGLVLRHIRWFTRRSDVFTRDGTLSVGWAYPNGYISEEYTSPQGPYWALKSFLVLALPADHAFWTIPEEPYPARCLNETGIVPAWRQVFSHAAGHTYMLNSGQMSFKPQRNDAAKYSKLAYSASFGFSIPTDPTTLRGMGPDSSVLVSLDGSTWKARRECKAKVHESGVVESIWTPYDGVTVTTWLCAPKHNQPYHTRLHRIVTRHSLHTWDGGFAIDNTTNQLRPARPLAVSTDQPSSARHGRWQSNDLALVHSIAGVSASYNPIETTRSAPVDAVVQDMDTGSNLIAPRTVVPGLRAVVATGETWLASRVFAIPVESAAYDEWYPALQAMRQDKYSTVHDLAESMGVELEIPAFV